MEDDLPQVSVMPYGLGLKDVTGFGGYPGRRVRAIDVEVTTTICVFSQSGISLRSGHHG